MNDFVLFNVKPGELVQGLFDEFVLWQTTPTRVFRLCLVIGFTDDDHRVVVLHKAQLKRLRHF